MAFSTVPLVATSDSWTASQHNTYIRDNFAAVWVGTTAGDTDYYSSSTAKTRLAIGTANQIKYSTGSAPAWGDLSTITANKAMVASQATGDFFYASSSTALARRAIGSTYQVVTVSGGVPQWASIVAKRLGGSSTAWNTTGTTEYTPSYAELQSGSTSVSISGGNGSTAVTFPDAYTYTPIVIATIYNTLTKRCGCYVSAISTTGFTVRAFDVDGETYSVSVFWMAQGA